MTTTPSSSPRLRLGIVGAGIAGLVFAIAVAPCSDIEINIYEGATKFEAIGAGIGLWGDCLTVLKRLGMLERLMKVAPAFEAPMHLRKANLEVGEPLGVLKLSRTMAFHRAHLLEQLVEILKETNRATIHFGKRCESYVQNESNEGVTIHFKDGSTATCDVLVGSDGIRSSVRKQMMSEITGDKGWDAQDPTIDSSGMRFSGTVAYRALINPTNLADHPSRKEMKSYLGTNKHLVTYPVAAGKFINLLGYSSNPDRRDEWMHGPWTTDVEGSEPFKEFADFEPEVKVLLAAVEKSLRWALYEVGPLPLWTLGRVALLGDACHAMNPTIGTGGGLSIEDGFVLAQLLGDSAVTRKDIPYVLRAYQFVRKPRVDKAIECTREAMRIDEYMGEYASADAKRVTQAFDNLTEWFTEGKYDIDGAVEEGRKEFERLKSSGGN